MRLDVHYGELVHSLIVFQYLYQYVLLYICIVIVDWIAQEAQSYLSDDRYYKSTSTVYFIPCFDGYLRPTCSLYKTMAAPPPPRWC